MRKILKLKKGLKTIPKRKVSKAVGTLALTLLILTIFPAYAGVPGDSHDADAMWIEPSTIDLSTESVSVGYCFNVTVWVNSTVEECAAWQFELTYNKAHLNATDCGYTAGGKSQFFEDITTIALTTTLGSFNATHNFVLHGETWGMSGPFRGPGYGSLDYVTFNVTAVPPEGVTWTSTIGLVWVGTETYLQDSDQNKILLNVYRSDYIIPEFPEFLIFVLLMSLTLVAAIVCTRLRSRNSKIE